MPSKPSEDAAFTALKTALLKSQDPDREFEQIVSVLVLRDEDQQSQRPAPARRYEGLWTAGPTVYLCWLPSQPDRKNRDRIVGEVVAALERIEDPKRWRRVVGLVPDRLPDSGTARSDFDKCVAALRKNLPKIDRTELWAARELRDKLLAIPPLALRYLPEYLPDGSNRKSAVAATRRLYDQEFAKLHGKIQFVGMSVYKEEASSSVPLERIYIPLRVVPEGATEKDRPDSGANPLELLGRGSRHVVLGDPGAGKSTLLRFLALAGTHPKLKARYGSREDERLPVLVTLRRYADELKSRPDLSLVDHVIERARDDLEVPSADREFFEYHLYAGQAILLFDGVDELPGPQFKATVRGRVAELLSAYPGNTAIVTSRLVGYDEAARFDGLGFSHHRVARLSLNEIEGFVQDWYAARIEKKSERQPHAADLVRIVRDPVNRAICELAENPLLLTIICLVHRIDAVLPDERVVLYEKCTETLLNTWHTWKFQTERQRNRNKIERRNRARMEAIAYWMHCLFEAEKETARSVAKYDDVRSFLAQYIEEVEKPRRGDPVELAEQFLRFVKETAGLMIEVGSGLYSFVHLTFQEYLTATHLRKSGEAGGVGVIWDFIADRCGDPRWHEVIRLLIGSFERTESQEYLLERILPRPGEEDAHERSLLAGGCLLDRIDAAEEIREEIVESLVESALSASSVEALRDPLRSLRGWQDSEADHRQVLAEVVARKSGETEDEATKTAAALILLCLGWDEPEMLQVTDWLLAEGRAGDVYASCGLAGISEFRCTHAERNLLRAARVWLSFHSPGGNQIAIVIGSLCPTETPDAPNPSFSQVLACTMALHGPFRDQLRFALLYGAGYREHWPRALAGARDRAGVRARSRSRDRVLVLALARDRALDRALALARDRALDRALALARDRALDRALDGATTPTPELRHAVIDDPELHTPVLDLICDLLALEPRAHWWETLRLRGLPHIPERITLTNPENWRRTLEAFAKARPTENDSLHAASQLLLDGWLWLTVCYDEPRESPFAKLAELTRGVDFPALRVAHCLRDLAFGDETRAEDLARMVRSEDAAYRRLFEDAFLDRPFG